MAINVVLNETEPRSWRRVWHRQCGIASDMLVLQSGVSIVETRVCDSGLGSGKPG